MTSAKNLEAGDQSRKQLTPKQAEVVDYMTSHRVSVSEAADALDMIPTNLYRILRYQHVKDEMQERLASRLKAGAVLAGEELLSLLGHKSAAIRLDASKELLKHNGPAEGSKDTGGINVFIDLSRNR